MEIHHKPIGKAYKVDAETDAIATGVKEFARLAADEKGRINQIGREAE